MKKSLVIICVVAVVVIVYLLLKSDKINQVLNTSGSEDNSESEMGRSTGAPSATDSSTYTVDKKSSSVSMSYVSSTKTESWLMPIQSGNIVMASGSVSGGSVLASMSNLKRTGLAFDVSTYPDATLAIKAVVFDRARSTTDNLVFRTDAELTMNGKTAPLSFDSSYVYSPSGMTITGNAKPDWKTWGLAVPTSDSMSMNILLHTVK